MNVDIKIGIAMTMPEGKLPGFYAQIVKGLASRTQLFDRDKELLVVSTAEERDAALDVLSHYKVGTEELELVLLPAEAATTPLFGDYGFTTRFDNRYLYRDRVALFTLRSDAPDDGRSQAQQQIGEYLIAVFGSGERDADSKERDADSVKLDADSGVSTGGFGERDNSTAERPAADAVYAVDRQHDELMERIAQAYRCSVEWL